MNANNEKVSVIIVAAGSSLRMDGINKIHADLWGMPVLERVIRVFEQSEPVDDIVLVVHPDWISETSHLVKRRGFSKIRGVTAGGARRQDSVSAGLALLPEDGWVVVHDGARPIINQTMITRGLDAARETGAAIAAMPVKDTIKEVNGDGLVTKTPDRNLLWLVQTPQVFRTAMLKQAHQKITADATDDAAMVEKLGHRVKVFNGSYDNIKITTPEDLLIAQALLKDNLES